MLQEYLTSPELFWPDSHQRNVKKLNAFLHSGAKSTGQHKNDYIESIIKAADLRKLYNSKHVYLVNTGSSGSHWIEAMLSFLPRFYNCGEVYLPKGIKKHLSTLSVEDASCLLDAIYLVHSGGIYEHSLTASLSNSAHLANHQQVSQYSNNKVAIFLLRNPVDVVLSRTFRKDEYKKDVAPDMTEREYLEKNCKYIEDFYNNVELDSFDFCIKYEDVLKNPFDSLRHLSSSIGIQASDEELMHAVDVTSKAAVEASISSGKKAATNIYLGERKAYSWASDYVNERLSEALKVYHNK